MTVAARGGGQKRSLTAPRIGAKNELHHGPGSHEPAVDWCGLVLIPIRHDGDAFASKRLRDRGATADKLLNELGSTGMITPNDNTSRTTVMKMKDMAARFGFRRDGLPVRSSTGGT